MNNRTTKTILFAGPLFIVFILFLSGCKKDDDDASNPIPPSGSTLKTAVTGRITDVNGSVLSGVTVKLEGISTVSDSRGYFLFVDLDVPKDRMVLVASKSGYFDCIWAKKTQSGDANYINLMMQSLPAAVNISGSAGGLVNIPGGATITFQTNSFVDQNGNAYTGQVKVFARHISPGDDSFEAIVPGGDLLGLNTLGGEQSLYSLGMIEAKLYDNSGVNEVKLAPGKTATLKFPIDASQNSVALSTIPLWHLDETTGLWQEDGQATKTGNFYTGNVSHFTLWNVDYSGPRADVSGKVVDCFGNPVSGVVVTINGFTNVITGNDGSYYLWVPAGFQITAQVLTFFNPSLTANSPSQSVLAVGGIMNTIPDLVIPCATRLMGTIKVCNTANNSPAFIIASWNGGSAIQFTSTGSFNLYVPENKAISIAANYTGTGYTTSLITGVNGSSITLPDITLCQQVNELVNSFQLNDSGTSTVYTVTITSSNSSFTDSNLDGIFENSNFLVNGIANPGGLNCMINVFAQSLMNDHFPLRTGTSVNQVDITIGSNYYSSLSQNLSNTTNSLYYTEYAPVGGIVSGIYEFTVDSDTYITTGIFSVVRDN